MAPFLTTKAQEWSAKRPEKPPPWIDGDKVFGLEFKEPEKPPLDYVDNLAVSSKVRVDLYKCQNTGQLVAVKIMKTYSVEKTIEKLSKEGEILRMMNHYHSIRAIGSYTYKDHLGIIMEPVADCDLQEYLFYENSQKIQKMLKEYGPRSKFLPRVMGCLANGLKYIHEQKGQPSFDHSPDHSPDDTKIRHRDITPSNILLHEKRVFFADFGLSKVYSDTQTGTSGSSRKTQMYTSPERAANTHRNTACDIFSLGCVFADIFTVIKGKSAVKFREERIKVDPDGEGYFYKTIPQVLEWLENLAKERCDAQIVRLIRSMLQLNYKERPTASKVWEDLSRCTSNSGVYFCGPCCMPLYRDDLLLHANPGIDPSQADYAVAESPHLNRPIPDDLSFKTKYEAGQGPSLQWSRNLRLFKNATLDVVKGQSPHPQARKRIFLEENETTSTRASNEAEILRKLRPVMHRHIVKLCSTYQHPGLMTLHFEPAAEFDLRSYLELFELRLMRSRHSPEYLELLEGLELLTESFGCLSGALAAIHAAGYDHGDIRPENILIHGNRIFISKFSFGLKHGSPAKGNSKLLRITNVFGFLDVENHESQPAPRRESPTPSPDEFLYKPPEWNTEPSKEGKPTADVFSLGCVFLEIYRVITEGRVWDFKDQRASAGNSAYRNTLPKTRELVRSFEQDQYDTKDQFVKMLLRMIDSDPKRRPTAADVHREMQNCYTSEGDILKKHRRCGSCASR